MAKRIFSVNFLPDTWFVEMSDMSLEERGLFIQLTCIMLMHQNPFFPLKESFLARQCNCHVKVFRRLLKGLVEKRKLILKEDGKEISHPLAEKLLTDANIRIARQALSMKRGLSAKAPEEDLRPMRFRM